jgi:hypothetical protein
VAFFGRIARRFARRSRWLAQRLWLVAALEVALISRRHWHRLEPEERGRLLELARKSRGRPSKNLSKGERRQASELLQKLDYAELGGNLTTTFLPFHPLGRLVEFALGRTGRSRRGEADAAQAYR